MSGNRIEFAQFGHFDSFDIIRSATSMAGVAEVDLPTPIATGLKTMYYTDTSIVVGQAYYYKARVWRGSVSSLSDEILCISNKDDYFNAVVSLLYFKDNFTDETGRVWTNTGVTFSNEAPIFGVKSGVFHNAELRSTNNVSLGLGDFTIEMWSKGSGSLFSKRIPTGTSNQGFTFFMRGDGRLATWNGAEEIAASTPTNLNELTHKAYVKYGDRLKIFNNGNKLFDEVYSLTDNSYPMQIGAALFSGAAVDFFNGLIAMPRITKMARYTENFIPPNNYFPNKG